MLPREEILKLLELLKDHFPNAFSKQEFVILKKGIDLDICKSSAISINITKLRDFLKIYTNHPGYIKAHTIGAKRYDLKGEVTGQVTVEEYESFTKFQQTRLKQQKFLKNAKVTEENKVRLES